MLVTLPERHRVTSTGEPALAGSVVMVPVLTESGEEVWMLIQDVWKD